MLGPSHRIAGITAWIAVAPLIPITPTWQIVAGTAVAMATSHGRLSPDVDRYPILGKLIPGPHRGITHFWIIPVLMYVCGEYLQSHERWPISWFIFAVAVAWASHIITDAVFGRVPILPRFHGWVRAGLGFRTGGFVEKFIAVPAFIIFAGYILI